MSHIHEKIDYTSEVFIVYGNTVLLRKHDKYKLWLSVGGHIELHEDPNQAAIREVKEEIGLDIILYDKNRLFSKDSTDYHELIPPIFLNRHSISKTHQHITLTYFARSETDKITPNRELEVSDELKWFTSEELDNSQYVVTESIKFYAKEALLRLGT